MISEKIKEIDETFYRKIVHNLPSKYQQSDLFLLENNLVGAKNESSIHLFGCPFCYLEPVFFNAEGEPCIKNTPLKRPTDNEELPVEIQANLLYCPKCNMLVNLFPNYNRQLME